jgi:hypothetical protein
MADLQVDDYLRDFTLSCVDNAPYDEQFVRRVEKDTFWNEYTQSVFSYNQIAAQIKKYGSTAHAFNEKHMKACFS